MPMFCTQCGQRNVDDAGFCESCGTSLTATSDSAGGDPVLPFLPDQVHAPSKSKLNLWLATAVVVAVITIGGVAALFVPIKVSKTPLTHEQVQSIVGDSLVANAQTKAPDDTILSFRGIGPVRLGMTVQEASAAGRLPLAAQERW